jgi:hypothetical protein
MLLVESTAANVEAGQYVLTAAIGSGNVASIGFVMVLSNGTEIDVTEGSTAIALVDNASAATVVLPACSLKYTRTGGTAVAVEVHRIPS